MKKKMNSLAKQLKEHNKSYYKDSKPVVSDHVYDLMYAELLSLERDYPQLIDYESPIQVVGSDLTDGFNKVKHEYPMLSIKNAMNFDELIEWIQDLDCDTRSIIAEEKIDGASLSVIYKNGILVNACTRGDGEIGDDVTQNAKMISGLPLVLKDNVNIEVRGEVYIERDNFNSLNEYGEYKNTRNLASGTLKLHDVLKVRDRKLKFKAFQLMQHDYELEWDAKRHLVRLGFDTTTIKSYELNSDNLYYYLKTVCETIASTKKGFNYDIDGIVFKVNEVKQRDSYTSTSKYHNWQIAYKFPQPKITAKLLSVDNQVGRSGVITPVANIEPTEILGTTVKRATLHNYYQVKQLKLGIGDIIQLEKGGEIIPKIIGVETHYGNEIPVPIKCPVCGTTLEIINDLKTIVCPNYTCRARLIGRLEHMVSKHAFNIRGLSTETLTKLVNQRIVQDITDLFNVDYMDLLKLPGFAEKSASKLEDEIDLAKEISLRDFIYSLGIPGVGKTVSRKLATIFKYVDDMVSYCNEDRDLDFIRDIREEIDKVGLIGDKIHSNFVEFFNNHVSIVNKFQHNGVIIEDYIEKEIEKGHFLFGKKVVITGTLSQPRDSIKIQLDKVGAIVSGSVSKNTDYLIVGENPGSKFTKAQSLGVKIINESEIW